MASRDMYVIDPPKADAPGRFLLIVQRSGASPFGGGSAAVVSVDSLKQARDGSIGGFLKGQTDPEVTFSAGTPYLLIKKSLARLTTEIEMTKEDYEAHKEMKALMEKLEPEAAITAVPGVVDTEAKTGLYL